MNIQPDGSERVARFLDRMLVTPAEKIARQAEGMGRRCCTDGQGKGLSPGVLWEGIFYGWAGYTKANREIVHRIANTLYVQIDHSIGRPSWNDSTSKARIDVHGAVRVADSCPLVRFLGPDSSRDGKRFRACWTMMESEVIHADMISRLNNHFDELWTPTEWNLDAFKRSGLTIPGRVMPLGVDSLIYRPLPKKPWPPCLLLSTSRAGEKAVPEGFIFLSVSLPSFRKGFDVLSAAFEEAFGDDPSVSLVIATTHFSPNVESLAGLTTMRSRIYALTGSYTEHEMASVYSSADAYATASRGEGWNLPVCEASCCGLPVIAPDSTSHPEVLGSEAFFFRSEGSQVYPGSESVSPWYKDVPFTFFGKKSHAELVDLLRLVRENGPEVRRRTLALRQRMKFDWTWDRAAHRVASRLMELQ